MTETLRTFIAIELPDTVRDFLLQLQNDLKKRRLQVRWVRNENIHLTLKFLGNIDALQIQEISRAIGQAAATQGPFDLKASGIGVFPTIRNTRVIWAGLSGDVEALRSLHTTLDRHLEKQGIQRERRPFKGHLTLGRSKGKIDARQMADAIVACGGVASEIFSVDHVSFIQSRLQKGGAVYRRIMQAPLGPA